MQRIANPCMSVQFRPGPLAKCLLDAVRSILVFLLTDLYEENSFMCCAFLCKLFLQP